MKIIFNRQRINNEVTPLMCATMGKATLSAIEGILIEATAPNKCVMTTFDLEKGVRITIDAKVEEEGCYIINAQKFVQTVKVMEGEEVTLTVDENYSASIVSGKSSHRMSVLPGSDFPTVPRLESDNSFIIGQSVLKKMMSKVMYAMGMNDQRPVLNGCFFRIFENRLMVVACDSFKLAKCSVETDIENASVNNNSIDFSFIIPSKTVNELYRLLSDNPDKKVKVFTTRKNIIFIIDELIFFSRLIDGEYIDFDRIIMRNHKISVKLNRAELLSALERAALVTEERIAGSVRSHVKLSFISELLEISANSTAGSTYDEISINHEGEDLVIAFNNRFLIESVRACSADEIRISLSSALTSVNIEPCDDQEELFMLLPVRMKE